MKQDEHNLLPEFNFESRLPGESALAFAYFEIYRDAGNQRSLRVGTTGLPTRNSRIHHWQGRDRNTLIVF